jgi:hypothetical protein
LLAAAAFVAGALLAGIGAGIWRRGPAGGGDVSALSAPTRNVLGQLPAQVTIHYYSLLPAGTAEPALQAFAGRVARLLDSLQSASGGKLQVTAVDTPAETNATAAGAEGIQAFNLEKGEACFLGLAIGSGEHQETFARLQPEWEPALEYDLARAIQRVASLPPPPKPAPEMAQPNPEVTRSIQQLIPDVKHTTLEDADRIFHDDFLRQCASAGQEIEAKVNAAAEQVSQAQSNGSAADEDAARKHLQEVQLAQGERLRALAARLQIQLALFRAMKNAATNVAQ